AAKSEADSYEDDGETLQYRRGKFLKRHFQQTTDAHSTVVEVSAPEGEYRPAARSLILEMWTDQEPKTVTIRKTGGSGEGETLPRLDRNGLAKTSRGWSLADGVLTIKEDDGFERTRVSIQY